MGIHLWCSCLCLILPFSDFASLVKERRLAGTKTLSHSHIYIHASLCRDIITIFPYGSTVILLLVLYQYTFRSYPFLRRLLCSYYIPQSLVLHSISYPCHLPMASRKRSRNASNGSSCTAIPPAPKRCRSSRAGISTLELLPTEIIQTITAFLPHLALTRLALASHHLHAHAQRALYTHLIISTSRKDCAKALFQNLLDRNDLAENARSVNVNADKGSCAGKRCAHGKRNATRGRGIEISKEDRAAFTARFETLHGHLSPQVTAEHMLRAASSCDTKFFALILSLCPKIRRIEANCQSTTWTHLLAPLFHPSLPQLIGLDSVTKISLSQSTMSFADRTSLANPNLWLTLLALVGLPALHTLRIDKVEAINAPDIPSPPPTHNPSALRTLELKDSVLRPSALSSLLTHTPHLSSLKITTPHHYANQYATKHAFTPWDGLAAALSPIQHSLEELDFDARGVWWHYQACWFAEELVAPMGCLRGFERLRKLRASEGVLFGGWGFEKGWEGLLREEGLAGVRDVGLLVEGGGVRELVSDWVIVEDGEGVE
ncbi:hypothetical protein K458DRAFT_141824 [Lentithecium fluviatile CBS 122367]|uniref:F-box domain-containing protein n=1 Tax=Lentithecium fluviatile CBS 122367 TaxID=1168545 RepID=A0A6G1IJ44_9PLEO|nr:hypothetical protein K458DRAFT_141824 [Lentithecium fluviatile CBS 122367]